MRKPKTPELLHDFKLGQNKTICFVCGELKNHKNHVKQKRINKTTLENRFHSALTEMDHGSFARADCSMDEVMRLVQLYREQKFDKMM